MSLLNDFYFDFWSKTNVKSHPLRYKFFALRQSKLKILKDCFKTKERVSLIVYKKTDEWYIEWQRMTNSDNEWYNEWQWMTTSDNEWYNEWQRVVQRVMTNGNEWCATSDKEWQRVIQRVTTNSNEWQRLTAVVQPMKTAQYTSKNGWLPSFQWQKQIHYYFKGWMAAIRVVK